MSEQEGWTWLREQTERLGIGGPVQSLLGCSWGHSIWTADDTEPCTEQAVRIMVIHAPHGAEPPEMDFRFCARHFARAEAETTRHGGTIEGEAI